MTEITEKMAEKIEWYQEVLELEPNSKVFFPLARLLVEASRQEEAALVLERGLERHGEFLEARLFLIEILHTIGRRDACARQIDKLSQMLSSYAGFWQAWATWLSETRGAADAASALRFLAANLAYGPLTLRDVIDRGVESLMAGAPRVAVQPGRTVMAEQTAAKMGTVATDSLLAAPVANVVDDSAADGGEDDSLFEAPSDVPFNPDMAMADDSPLPEQPVDGGSAESELAIELDETTENDLSLDAVPLVSSSVPAQFAQLSTEDGEERFSLRTRSMAEVLAEQGDIRGALDIYHELEAVATTPDELEDLQDRINTLNASLGSHEPLPEDASPLADNFGGKGKLISILEALAERVEARAHG